MPASASTSSDGLRVRMRSGDRLPKPLSGRPKTRKSIVATSEDLPASAFVLVYFPQDKTTTIVPKRKVEGWITPGKNVGIRAGKNWFQGTVIAADDSNEPLELCRAEFEKECFKGNKQVDEEAAVKRFITKRGAIMDEMAKLIGTETDPTVDIKRRKIICQSKGKKNILDKWNIDSETEELQEPSSTSHQTIQQGLEDALDDGTIHELQEDASLQKSSPAKKSLTEISVVEIAKKNRSQSSEATRSNQNTSPLASGNLKASGNIGPENVEGNDQRNVSMQIRRRKRHFMKHIPVRQQYRHLLSSSVSTESVRPPSVASHATVSCQDINHLAKKKQNVHNQSPAQDLINFSSSHGLPANFRAESMNVQENHASVLSPTSTTQGRTSFSSFKEVPSSSSPYQVNNSCHAVGPSISFSPSTSQGSATAAVHLHCNCGSQLGEVIQELRCIRRFLESIMNDLKKSNNQSLLVVDGQPSCVTFNHPQSLKRFQRSNAPLSEPHYQTSELEKKHLYMKDHCPLSTNSTLEEEPLEFHEAEEHLTALIEPSDHYDQEEISVEETADLPIARHQLKEFEEANEDYSISQIPIQQNEKGETGSEFPQNAGIFPLENQRDLSNRELEEILSNCNSPQQFAVCIMRKIFTEKERLSGNVNGCGKPRLNPLKIKYIKECVEKFYEFDKNDQAVWKVCVKAIDSANRSFRNRNEVMKKRAAEAVASAIQNTL